MFDTVSPNPPSLMIHAASASATQVTDLRITTDGSVDCSSLESIVASVCREGMDEQAKAVALYEFARRMMFHYPNRVFAAEYLDPLDLLNTYGYSFCSRQAILTVALWHAAGLDAAVWSTPHHSTMQVHYGGSFHWFDLLIGGYVYRRDGRTIASLRDIAADHSLLTDAVGEGRAPSAFMPCGHVLKGDAVRFSKDSPENIRYCSQYADDAEHMAAAAHLGHEWEWGDPPRSRYRSGFTLRRGERIIYLWDYIPGQASCNVLQTGESPRPYWVTAEDLPPHHFCGAEAERRDTLNAELWQRYTKRVAGVETGRYAANGRHIYAPDLSRTLCRGDWMSNSFAQSVAGDAGPYLRIPDDAESAMLVCPFVLPHIYTGGVLAVEFHRAAADDISRVYLSTETRGRGPALKYRRRQLVWDAATAGVTDGPVTALIPLEMAIRHYRNVQVEIHCATTGARRNAGVRSLRFDGIFQHNMFARPYLVNGSNRVTVRVESPLTLQSMLQVTYVWREADVERTHVQSLTHLPATYGIDVGGTSPPRMLRMEMAMQ